MASSSNTEVFIKAAERFGVYAFRDHQLEVCLEYYNGRDSFFIAPTGFGKSLVYQVAPLVFHSEDPTIQRKVLIIQPTIALISDSISKLERYVPELPAVHLTPATRTKAKSSVYIFTSPEMLLGDFGREVILTDVALMASVAAVFVDECHIIEECYHVVSAAAEEASNFDFLIELLRAESTLPKTLVFFNQIKHLTAAFSYITHHIGQKVGDPFPKVAMFISVTDGDRKQAVLGDLNNPQGIIRVVLCTSSLAVGVNMSQVGYTIHYGMPTLAQDFLQETGRAARESSAHGHSITITFPRENHNGLSAVMKDYKKGLKCRRLILLSLFKSTSDISGQPTCCDVCNEQITHPFKIVMDRHFENAACDSDSISSVGSDVSLSNLDLEDDYQ